MKQPLLPDYSEQPCKSIIAENINAVKNGKELTAPLAYLNKSCEFRKKYEMIVGTITRMSDEEKVAWRNAYRQRPEFKAYQKAYQKAYSQRPKTKAYKKTYYQRPEVKARQKAYYQIPEVKARMKAHQKAYYQRKKLEEE